MLFRVALALLKLHEPLLLAQDNEGELLRATRRLAAEAFDRDALMKVRSAAGSLGMGWWALRMGDGETRRLRWKLGCIHLHQLASSLPDLPCPGPPPRPTPTHPPTNHQPFPGGL